MGKTIKTKDLCLFNTIKNSMMKTNKQFITIIFLLCLLLPSMLHAQPIFEDDVPDDIPIDGGLCLLVTVGVGYATKRLRKK